MNTLTIDSRALEGVAAVLIPAGSLKRFGPLVRSLNGGGVPWALYRASAPGGVDGELGRCARRLGVDPARCLVLRDGPSAGSPGWWCRFLMVLDDAMERFRLRGMASLERTMRGGQE